MGYIIHLAIVCAIYAMAVWSLDLIVGRLRIFSLFHAALLGVGAYAYALATTRFGVPGGNALLVAAAVTMAASMLSSVAIGRLRNEQAMIFTLALQGLLISLALNLEVTHGPYGIAGLRPPSIGQPTTLLNTLAISISFMLLTAGAMWMFDRSQLGVVSRAVGGDEVLTLALGINVTLIKMIVFAAAGAAAGLAGALLAGHLTFIDPQSFSLSESMFLLTALLIGGTGNRLGPLLGVAILILVPEALRFVEIPSAMAGHAQRIVFAGILITIVRFRPQGLAGEASL